MAGSEVNSRRKALKRRPAPPKPPEQQKKRRSLFVAPPAFLDALQSPPLLDEEAGATAGALDPAGESAPAGAALALEANRSRFHGGESPSAGLNGEESEKAKATALVPRPRKSFFLRSVRFHPVAIKKKKSKTPRSFASGRGREL